MKIIYKGEHYMKKDANKIITNIVRILIILIAIFLIFQKKYKNLGILALTMILTFYDKIVEKFLKIQLDQRLKISLIIFIFGAQCLGTSLEFYDKFPWWDTMLHTVSGLIFFLVGVTVIKQLSKKTENKLIDNKIILAFGICFSLSTGVVWEIFEFVVDIILEENMQLAKGLVGQDAIMDTMIDLISVTVGTTFMAIHQYINDTKKKKIKNV